MSDFSVWFKSIPFFTRYWFAATIALTLIGRFGLINPMYLYLFWEPITRFQVWRFITCIFYYPLSPATGFHFLINVYFLYKYSSYLESSGFYSSKPADYFFMLVFNAVCCITVGLFVNLPFLMDPMVLSVLYVWCQLNKEVIVNFWFGSQFKAMYLPWVLLGFNMVINGGGLFEIIGILVGHFYFYLMFIYPAQTGNSQLLTTPAIFKQWFPSQTGGVYGFGVPPERAPSAAPPTGGIRRVWGQGHRLGSN